jgi:hypothetical protein
MNLYDVKPEGVNVVRPQRLTHPHFKDLIAARKQLVRDGVL